MPLSSTIRGILGVCCAAIPCLAPLQGAEGVGRESALTVPRLGQAPVIDGVIDAAEWQGAVAVSGVEEYRSDGVIPRPTTFWLGWDAGRIYLACRAWMKPGMVKPRVGGRSPHTADCFDAGLELHLQPLGRNVDAAKTTTSFKFNANALGHCGTYSRVAVGQVMSNWLPSFACKARVAGAGTAPLGGSWLEMEWSGTVEDFELTGPNRAGDTWRMLLGFNQMGHEWTQALIPITSDYFNPQGYPLITLAEAVPAVQVRQEKLPGLRDGVASAVISVFNPTATPVQVTVLARYADQAGELLRKESTLTIEAGREAGLAIDEPFPRKTEGGTAFFQVRQGERELLRHTLAFKSGYAKGWIENTQPPGFPLSATFNPIRSNLQVVADSYYLERPEAVERFRYRVFKEGAGTALTEGTIAEARTAYYSRQIDLPGLGAGEYRLEGALVMKDGTEKGPQVVKFRKLDEAAAFPGWWKRRAGNIERVLPPFTALRQQDAEVASVGRRYRLGQVGLPQAIEANGGSVLRAPARIVVTSGGKRQVLVLDGAPSFTEVKEWRVSFEGSAAGAGLVFRGKGWIEQDGLTCLDLSYAPAGEAPVAIDALSIEFPIAAEEAEGVLCLGPGGNFASKTVKLLPDRQGALWSTLETGRMGSGMAVGSFHPCVWVGNDRRGLLWWGDSDQGWVPEDGVPAHDLYREGDAVVLRNNIIGSPFTLAAARTITFAYNASPFKPLRKGWRTTSFSFYGQAITEAKDEQTGKPVQHFHMLTPPTADAAKWGEHWAAQKKRSDAEVHRLLATDPAQLRRDTSRTLQYSTCLMGYGAKTLQKEVFDYFAAEWKSNGYEVYNDTLIDYYTWFIDRACREGGLKTIYWDIVFFVNPLNNRQAGVGYQLPDGRIQPTFPGLRARRFLMHTYAIFEENGANPGAQVGHGTNDYLLVALPWFDAMLDGEFHNIDDPSTIDWVDGYPLDRMRVMSCSHTFGTPISWMDLVKTTDRARTDRILRGQIDYLRLFDSWNDMNWHGLRPGSPLLDWGLSDEAAEYVPFWRNRLATCADERILVSLWRLPGRTDRTRSERILLVAFNNSREGKRDAVLKVDLAALGMQPRPWQEFLGVRAVEDLGERGRSAEAKEPEPVLDAHAGTITIKDIQPHTARIISLRKY